MATADQQIRVSARVKRLPDRRRREGESYNDVLERILDLEDNGNFDDGFGRWSTGQAERVREQRKQAKAQRKERMSQLTDEGEDADE